jgi:predicted glycoside hydrolase/deacetylase ChbG (UPF0249 family)
MANGPAFEDAVAIARAHPTLGVGCHIVLTDGIPVSPPHTIASLLGPDRRSFRSSLLSFVGAALSGRIRPDEVAREAAAQIGRLQQAGIRVTHIDTHKHTHIFPSIARPLLETAASCEVGAIRNPFEPAWSRSLSRCTLLRRIQIRLTQYLRPRFLALPQIRSGQVQTSDGTLGISATGQLNHDTLASILRVMPSGVWELVCHPGYNDRDLDAITTRLRHTREIEREALLAAFSQGMPRDLQQDSRAQVHPREFELIHYLQAGRKMGTAEWVPS